MSYHRDTSDDNESRWDEAFDLAARIKWPNEIKDGDYWHDPDDQEIGIKYKGNWVLFSYKPIDIVEEEAHD